jgi:haloacetate dehalogenase
MEDLYGDPAAVWEPWCRLPVTSAVIDSGHHMAEEAPEQLAELLVQFLSGAPVSRVRPESRRPPPAS